MNKRKNQPPSLSARELNGNDWVTEVLPMSHDLPLLLDEVSVADCVDIRLHKFMYASVAPKKDLYKFFGISKRDGSSRKIAAPRPLIKAVQKKLSQRVIEKWPIPDYITGFRKGYSCIDTARVHARKGTVISLDKLNFFSFVRRGTIRWMLNEHYGYNWPVANMISDLFTIRNDVELPGKGDKTFKKSWNSLPQGSPASPAVANAVIALTYGPEMAEYCDTENLNLTIYADDITVSNMTELQIHCKSEGLTLKLAEEDTTEKLENSIKDLAQSYVGKPMVDKDEFLFARLYELLYQLAERDFSYDIPDDVNKLAKDYHAKWNEAVPLSSEKSWEIIHKLTTIVRSAGFYIKFKKTKVMDCTKTRQTVMGVTVNEGTHVQDKLKYFRAVLHNVISSGWYPQCKVWMDKRIDQLKKRYTTDESLEFGLRKEGFVNEKDEPIFEPSLDNLQTLKISSFISWLMGNLNWIKAVDPHHGEKLLREFKIAYGIWKDTKSIGVKGGVTQEPNFIVMGNGDVHISITDEDIKESSGGSDLEDLYSEEVENLNL